MVLDMPDQKGCFGTYGGSFLPEELQVIIDEITESYLKLKENPIFKLELQELNQSYTGRPSPIYYAESLSRNCKGAQIFLKREDLNHTGAHKINHCLGEALLAKYMGKKKLIAETGAGQHGVALSTAAALVGLPCEIYMGEVDVEKEYPNVIRMKILGAKVHTVSEGTRTLKDAVDAAFKAYLQDPVDQFYAIGSVVGPHPFPMMVRDFQEIVGKEAKEQFAARYNKLPDNLVACVGGGSNAIGLFTAFLPDEDVNIFGVEPAGLGLETADHAATLTLGKAGVIHGFKCYLLQDDSGNPLRVYSVASGLDYPGVGPQHSYLKDIGRINYKTITDAEAIEAFFQLSRLEGIIPALESAHAVAYAMKLASELPETKTILVNLSGRGDKDIDFVARKYGREYDIT
ncbi:MAG: tryptophan synthase subunit beta [Candidatus Cloacimonetes bacterium]|nr:tryptophan synthase subunit beta [Candidatus Cloacimonadota bacterium]MCF7814715.1 tryptophan synthase subunit beta [Candidatus Cloacimonadota bacterium]MCF7869144.1 tryptophan synthase subunit beta [Candidatus Cloacimonadota bacterium]MCF7884587.1 tryptophan synthase subunit beta [Candidatus Cloacimonadota bacterium]